MPAIWRKAGTKEQFLNDVPTRMITESNIVLLPAPQSYGTKVDMLKPFNPDQGFLFDARIIRSWPTHGEIRSARRRRWESVLLRNEAAVDPVEQRRPVATDTEFRSQYPHLYGRKR